MSTMISAKLVAESVRLPLMARTGRGTPGWYPNKSYRLGEALCLSDPQTAFGVAIRLDRWERAGDPDWGVAVSTWAEEIGARHDVLAAMITRLTHIAHDHAIRRAVDVAVEPGTLAELKLYGDGSWWMRNCDGDMVAFHHDEAVCRVEHHDVRHVPALAGITDHTEVLAAIYAEVVGA